MDIYNFTNALEFARDLCRKKLNIGDIAVDATMGNGHDTVLMGQLVGEKGKVYSFDIQESALINTKKVVDENKLLADIKLILDGHENMDEYITDKVKVIMFNLGYLPKGEHGITTKVDTTLIAVKKSMQLLKKGGIIALVIYHGHEEGKAEKNALEDFASSLNQKEYSVVRFEFINQINNPPLFIGIERR